MSTTSRLQLLYGLAEACFGIGWQPKPSNAHQVTETGTCLSMRGPSKRIRVDSPSDRGHLWQLEFKPINFPCNYAIHRHSCFTPTPPTTRKSLWIHSGCDKGYTACSCLLDVVFSASFAAPCSSEDCFGAAWTGAASPLAASAGCAPGCPCPSSEAAERLPDAVPAREAFSNSPAQHLHCFADCGHRSTQCRAKPSQHHQHASGNLCGRSCRCLWPDVSTA